MGMMKMSEHPKITFDIASKRVKLDRMKLKIYHFPII